MQYAHNLATNKIMARIQVRRLRFSWTAGLCVTGASRSAGGALGGAERAFFYL